MTMMAIDHASALIARVHFTEIWGVAFKGYSTAGWWFTRFVSHLCAPGFFFLMGVSMMLLANKEFNEVRSIAEFPGLLTGSFLIPTSVLFGLSICMAVGAFFWRLNVWLLSLISIMSFVLSTGYVSFLHAQTAFHPTEHILIVPGMSDGILVLYPLIPWVGVTTLGMFWAKLYYKYRQKIYTISFWIGFAFLLTFLIFRFIGFGNFQYNEYKNWIDFFTLVKYPPSITFILCTMGINLMLLTAFHHIHHRFHLKPLIIFGQTAMFFYIIHLWLYAIIGIAFPSGCSIFLMYGLWFVGLIVLYFLCRAFLNFKRNKPKQSLWRMV